MTSAVVVVVVDDDVADVVDSDTSDHCQGFLDNSRFGLLSKLEFSCQLHKPRKFPREF